MLVTLLETPQFPRIIFVSFISPMQGGRETQSPSVLSWIRVFIHTPYLATGLNSRCKTVRRTWNMEQGLIMLKGEGSMGLQGERHSGNMMAHIS